VASRAGRQPTNPLPDPGGTPVDQATLDGVNATIYELAACSAAGEPLRGAARYTDGTRRRLAALATRPITAADVAPATPDPSVARSFTTADARALGVQRLSDGRVRVIPYLTIDEPGHPPSREPYFVLVEQDGRYLIDDIVFVRPPAPIPGLATPSV